MGPLLLGPAPGDAFAYQWRGEPACPLLVMDAQVPGLAARYGRLLDRMRVSA